jgi:hypothetical protein
MEQVIVSIKRKSDAQGQDFEVPITMTASSLVQEFSSDLGWDSNLEIYAAPPERILGPDETLEMAGVWDGAWLIFQPIVIGTTIHGDSTNSPSLNSSPGDGPLRGWRVLDNVPPAADSGEGKPPAPSGGFVWKRIDRD